MSWDARLTDDRGHVDGDWNYTHNCNPMCDAVLGKQVAATATPFWGGHSWWALLDGLDGLSGRALLASMVESLAADPERFEAMNPKNGWGSYVELVGVLREMRDAVPDWPTTWTCSG